MSVWVWMWWTGCVVEVLRLAFFSPRLRKRGTMLPVKVVHARDGACHGGGGGDQRERHDCERQMCSVFGMGLPAASGTASPWTMGPW